MNTLTPLIPLSNFAADSTLMVQGCTSDAGKTVMVAALCRLLARHVNVAPFKPQNMALNSAVTPEGGEIGRAQALQAVAAGLEAHTDFNPILLKPSSDTGSQVIVHGRAINDMQARDYHDYKRVAMQAVRESFYRLKEKYQRIVVEGAGSPAEINLRAGDIANMGFAEEVDCPVVLVADIDRGGVFAHLVGTLELLSASEQSRIVGFIINRFRGDISLLQPGLDWLERRTDKPVLGVIPYLHNLFLDAEDAIDATQAKPDFAAARQDVLNVVIPVLPRISNHTDFDALRLHPRVNLRFVSVEESDRNADVIILPGSKNVIGDLGVLLDNDWAITINKHLRYGGKIIGVCGGYQMLGHLISDPKGVENNGHARQTDGFGLLEIQTQLARNKQLNNVSAEFVHSGFNIGRVSGYEIHCGQSRLCEDSFALFKLENGQLEGCVSQDQNVIGTYIHGLFDTPSACSEILRWAGLDSDQAIDIAAEREQQLDRIADCLQQHLRADFLDQLLGSNDSQRSQQTTATL